MQIKTKLLSLITIIIFCYALFGNINDAKANQVLFEDNFNDGNADGWVPINDIGPSSTHLWRVNSLFQYGMYDNIPYNASNSILVNRSWSDIEWKFDLIPLRGLDRNFLFRVKEYVPNQFYYYELHFSGTNVDISKHAPSDINQEFIFPVKTTYPLQNGLYYNFIVTLLGNHFIVEIKESNETTYSTLFDFYDNNMPITEGTIGLRIGTGYPPPTEVYYDNIVVTDLSAPTPTPTNTPTPTPTPFPYFAQNDPQWSGTIYDKLKYTIGQVGCALTSQVMVLKSFGLDKVPWGDELRDLDPETFNAWLNAEKATTTWWRNGNANPKASVELSLALNASDAAKFNKIDHKHIGLNQNATYQALLEQHIPLVFTRYSALSSSGSHYIVAHGINTATLPTTYRINDPLSKDITIYSSESARLQQITYYYKTSSNFSYLMLNSDLELIPTIQNGYGKIAGFDQLGNPQENIPQSHSVKYEPIANAQDPEDVLGPANWHISLKEPGTQRYTITLDPRETGNFNFEVYLYDALNRSQVISEQLHAQADVPIIFILDYDQTDVQQSFAKRITSFELLKRKVSLAYEQGWITHPKTRDQLLKHIDVAEKVYQNNDFAGKVVLNTVNTLIGNFSKQDKVLEPATSLLTEEVDLLISIL